MNPEPSHPLKEAAGSNPLTAEVQRMRETIARQAREIVRLQAVAGTDPLTGIANRRRWDEELEQRVALFERLGHGFCLVLIDLDHFKSVNDRWGHATGDQVLRSFASLLRKGLRATDLPARIGGDEFGVLMAGASRASAETVMARSSEFMKGQLEFSHPQIQLEWSIGYAGMRAGISATELYALADEEMFRAKRGKSGLPAE